MSRYNVLLYDKDNDIYTTVISTDNTEIAHAVAKSFNKFVHRDMVYNVGYDYKEPFDAVLSRERPPHSDCLPLNNNYTFRGLYPYEDFMIF